MTCLHLLAAVLLVASVSSCGSSIALLRSDMQLPLLAPGDPGSDRMSMLSLDPKSLASGGMPSVSTPAVFIGRAPSAASLSIVYTPGAGISAFGLDWDVPFLYVRRANSVPHAYETAWGTQLLNAEIGTEELQIAQPSVGVFRYRKVGDALWRLHSCKLMDGLAMEVTWTRDGLPNRWILKRQKKVLRVLEFRSAVRKLRDLEIPLVEQVLLHSFDESGASRGIGRVALEYDEALRLAHFTHTWGDAGLVARTYTYYSALELSSDEVLAARSLANWQDVGEKPLWFSSNTNEVDWNNDGLGDVWLTGSPTIFEQSSDGYVVRSAAPRDSGCDLAHTETVAGSSERVSLIPENLPGSNFFQLRRCSQDGALIEDQTLNVGLRAGITFHGPDSYRYAVFDATGDSNVDLVIYGANGVSVHPGSQRGIDAAPGAWHGFSPLAISLSLPDESFVAFANVVRGPAPELLIVPRDSTRSIMTSPQFGDASPYDSPALVRPPDPAGATHCTQSFADVDRDSFYDLVRICQFPVEESGDSRTDVEVFLRTRAGFVAPFRPWGDQLSGLPGAPVFWRIGRSRGLLTVSTSASRVETLTESGCAATHFPFEGACVPRVQRVVVGKPWHGRLHEITNGRGDALVLQYEEAGDAQLAMRLSALRLRRKGTDERVASVRYAGLRSDAIGPYFSKVTIDRASQRTVHTLARFKKSIVATETCDVSPVAPGDGWCSATEWIYVQRKPRPKSLTHWVVQYGKRTELPLLRTTSVYGEESLPASAADWVKECVTQITHGTAGETDVLIEDFVIGGARVENQRLCPSVRDVITGKHLDATLDFRYVTETDEKRKRIVAGKKSIELFSLQNDKDKSGGSVIRVSKRDIGITTYRFDALDGSLREIDWPNGMRATVKRRPFDDLVEGVRLEAGAWWSQELSTYDRGNRLWRARRETSDGMPVIASEFSYSTPSDPSDWVEEAVSRDGQLKAAKRISISPDGTTSAIEISDGKRSYLQAVATYDQRSSISALVARQGGERASPAVIWDALQSDTSRTQRDDLWSLSGTQEGQKWSSVVRIANGERRVTSAVDGKPVRGLIEELRRGDSVWGGDGFPATRVTRDALGRVRRVGFGVNGALIVTYDGFSRLERVEYAEGAIRGTLVNEYSTGEMLPSAEVLSMDGRSLRTEYQYKGPAGAPSRIRRFDASNQVDEVEMLQTTPADGVRPGLLSQMRSARAEWSAQYDGAGRVRTATASVLGSKARLATRATVSEVGDTMTRTVTAELRSVNGAALGAPEVRGQGHARWSWRNHGVCDTRGQDSCNGSECDAGGRGDGLGRHDQNPEERRDRSR